MRLPILIFTIFLGAWGFTAQAKTSTKNKGQGSHKSASKSASKAAHRSKRSSTKPVTESATGSATGSDKKSDEKPVSSGLKKEFRFSALDVNGRYQTAGSMDTKVETEKVLTDILSLRTDFKDRVKAETKRR